MVCLPLRWWCVQGVCAGGMSNTLLLLQTPCFCSGIFKSGSWVFWSLCIFCSEFAPTSMHAVIFSPIEFLCILLPEKRCVQVQALQHCSKGARVPACLIFIHLKHSTVFYSFFFLIDLYWSIIASQYCVSFCCTTK